MAWWSRTSPNRAPDGLVAALIEWRKSRPATETPPAPEENAPDLPDAGHVPSAPAPPSTTDQLEHIDPATLGLEHELGRLELLAARLSKEAHKPGQAKSYLDAVARMTATSSKLREEMEKQRRLIPRLEAEAAILEFHDPIQRGIRDLYVKWCETTGLPPSPERLEAWNREIDVLFSRFGEEVFR